MIRISCASLASIIIDDKYLLCMNKSSLKKGLQVYTPFGGALEYKKEALDFLVNIDADFEKGMDLRFKINKDNLDLYKIWFKKQIDREVGIDRELIEEFVDEEKIFNSLSINDFKSTYVRLVEDIEYYNEIENYRYFEIYDIKFKSDKISEIKNKMDSYGDIKKLILVSKDEIMNEITSTGIKIGANSKSIIQ